MNTSAQAPLYQCNVDIGPHFLIPRLEPLEVRPDRLVFQRQIPLGIPLSAIENLELKNWWGYPAIVLHYRDLMGQAQRLRFVDSNRLTPNRTDTQILFDLLQRLLVAYHQSAPADSIFQIKSISPDQAQVLARASFEAQAQREAQGWGIAFLIGGAISLLGSSLLGLDPIWGLFLLGIGLVAWRTKEFPWLIVVGLFLWWAALENMVASAGSSRWIRSAFVQVILGGTALYRYFNLRDRLQRPLSELAPVAARWMPLVALVAGMLSLLLLGGLIVGFTLGLEERVANILFGFVLPLAILSVSAGLAALVSFPPRRLLSSLGLVVGIIGIAVNLWLISTP